MKRLLIAGIDPGTTLGYALIDLDGRLVKTRSSKQLEMSSLILEMIKEGKVAVIGTDKGKTPKFIEKLASKIGARTIKPDEDMNVEDKRELTRGYDLKDEHEKDALASALYAFKRIRGLLNKIDNYLEENKKTEIKDQVREIMLKDKGLRIHEAVERVERPDEEVTLKRKRIKTGKMKKEEPSEDEAIKYDKDFVRKMEQMNRNMHRIIKTKMRKIIRIKNQKIDTLIKNIKEKQEQIEKLDQKLTKLENMIKKAEKHVILKKIKSLAWEEIGKEELGKTLYVEDPNVFSEKSTEKIREEVEVIISKKEMSKKLTEKFEVTFINANKVDAEEEGSIILINKEKLEKEKNKTNVVKKVIEEYRESRK
jgi:predicted RNase H-like nuclease (RuvC/YqgF family)